MVPVYLAAVLLLGRVQLVPAPPPHPPPGIASCKDVNDRAGPNGAVSGEYYLTAGKDKRYKVYCEFYDTHIYTFVAPTSLAFIPSDNLYNNKKEVLIRHRLNDGTQREVKYSQIQKYRERGISVQYNQNDGYNAIQNSKMGPYIYVGLLPIVGIEHKGDIQGYSVDGRDFTFTNCDGNPNNYFALLFNENNEQFTGYNVDQPLMRRWLTFSSLVPTESELPEDFFSQFEMHMGGCGGYLTSNQVSLFDGATIGLRYDIPISSCKDVYDRAGPNGVVSGEYNLTSDKGELYKVYCEFHYTHIFTFITPTSLPFIPLDNLYNNKKEVLIRHRLDDGTQREVKYSQIQKYRERGISVQYNQNDGYNAIQNSKMGPYIYVGLLPIVGIEHKGDIQGYSVDGRDFTFTNCDGNPNNYFALLFNKNNEQFTGYNVDQPMMRRWLTFSSLVPTESELPEEFFSQFEMHMGGCGGYLTSNQVSLFDGATIGLRYDLRISSCKDVYDRAGPNGAVSGEYYLTKGKDKRYKVYCEFYDTHIYTFVAPTSFASIPLDKLYNNKKEVLIRHRLDDGTQREVKYSQIQKYRERGISVQYNQNDGYNAIQNSKMGPYIYVGLLPIVGIEHKGDIQGYSVDGRDFTFTNCDGNPNNYLALLFNENNEHFTGYNVDQPLMRRWLTFSSLVPTESELPEDFFSQFEMHMGGCGGYLTSNQVSQFDGATIGLRYDIPISSCKDVYDRAGPNGVVSGEYNLTSDKGELYKVYCEFHYTHIFTFITPTSLPSIPLDNLYNNKKEVLIRHRLDDGTQREVKYSQIQKYRERGISVQYNQNDGYNAIQNSKMGPYIYVGLLPIVGIEHKGDIQGYSVDGRDFTFTNCDGNPNNYFALLFNKNNEQFTGYNVDQPMMRRWLTFSSLVPTESELPEEFFSQFEMHMGGCGGYLTSNQVSLFDGATIGLRYDLRISSCKDVYDRAGPNGVVSGEYYLTKGKDKRYKVYCEFYDTHIYTFVAPTSFASIHLDKLYNNKKEVLIRHRLDDGTQREVKYSQIQKYRERGISLQYNQNDGYNAIQNSKMGPYIYVGLLPIVGIEHKRDIQGYSVDGRDFTFTNCDGNPNNYFALLFNENNEQFTGYNVDQPLMRRWLTFSSLVPTESELPEDFFSQFEMHMGGCGGYLTSNQVSQFDGATIGLRYDIPISSCKDVYDRAGPNGVVSGEYNLTSDEGELYKVYCEFHYTHIFTFITPTSLPSISLDNLYNNKKEVLIRHRLDDGTQREVKYSQIQKYRERGISVQYNQNDGYNAIQNSKMGPYIYVGLLPIVGIEHKGDIQGYSVDGRDFTFTNCDGNPNNYFALLFNKNNEQFTGYNVDQPMMRRWLTFSSLVPTESELPEEFFSQFEMHMGGCGGYLTSNQVSLFDGATIGLRYDLRISSCKDVYDRAGPNGVVSGEYYLTKGKDKRYKVYCEFYDTHIYTFVAPTSFASIHLDKLYNNKKEVLIRHRLDDGTQREVKYSQIQKYRERGISLQYNQNDGYNAIQNSKMGPYIYVGLLPIVGIEHKGDIQGYSVDGRDFTFTNCDGNPNNYFALLFNENNEQFTGYNVDQPLMRRWLTFSSLVPTESELPEDFFSQFEMHMGGCGGYLTSNQVSQFDGATIGLRYDIPISSCKDVYDRAGPNGVVSGEYNLTSDEGELYKVYCEFHYTHIFTFITPTSLPSIPLDNLYNNKKEVLIRHRLDDGTQREVKYSQIQKYRERGISVQYNQNDGYNAIQNSKMGPYIYVGLLPIVGIEHKGDIQGYSVDGRDFTFTNCDGNPNNYFALLFNKNNEQFTGYNVDQPMMRRWLTFSSLVPTESELPEEFFSQFEMHMGGCGGYLTSNQVSLFDGATIGLRYDLRISSCKDVYDRAGPNGAVSGEYYLTKGKDKRYKVYCEFYDTHIYTFVAPTSFASIPLDKLYNNKKEVLIRHRLDDGTQREVKYSQIQKYRERNISVQYNQNDGYNAIQNSKMVPYIYVGLLPIVGIEHKGDIQGYSVDGRDFTFKNCDGNPNNYFALLFNENNEQFTGYNVDQPLMRRWLTFSSLVPTESELPEDFFSQFEMHMGGCGGYLTSNQVSRFDGATVGLRYDIPSS